MIMLTTDQVKALLLIAADKDVRYYLRGIYFDPTGFAVATDGTMLAAIKIEPFAGEGFIMPRYELAQAAKMKAAVVEIDPTRAGAITCKPIDGKYPEWRRVTEPALRADEAPAVFHADVMARAQKFVKQLGSKSAVEFMPRGDNAGIAMHSFDDRVLLIAMPMGGSDRAARAAATRRGMAILGLR